eukprot:gb/GEZN01005766.1/.p1 GENE.gb/GEZN01005766.1/~~gb/GEZN01005766.1/.p1  ORF type:complete len:482 (+),score=72.29 gb/GEZN01005766.1/:26-1471(+)
MMRRGGLALHRSLAGRSMQRLVVRPFVSLMEIKMPALSPTMEAGRITEWSVKVGEPIKAGQTMAQIETDKATVAFDSTEDGFLAGIAVEAGHEDEVKVNAVIGFMVEDQEELQEAATAIKKRLSVAAPKQAAGQVALPSKANSAAPASPAAVAQGGGGGGGGGAGHGPRTASLSPAVAHLLRSHKIDYKTVTATGRGGRILKSDVLGLLSGGGVATAPAPKAAAKVPAKGAAEPAKSGLQEDVIGQRTVGRGRRTFEDKAPSSMRKVIAKRLAISKATVPHSYSSITCTIDSLLAMRKALKERSGASVNDYVIKAAACALRDVPQANTIMDPKTGETVISPTVDISVAVAIPEGLITPIVKKADSLTLNGINAQMKELADLAKKGKLLPEQFQGGSFTISNLGMFGITEFSAVINPPQACILAVGGPVSKLRQNAKSGLLEPITTLTVTLSSDRRLVDEEVAALYLQSLQRYLEDPEQMIL